MKPNPQDPSYDVHLVSHALGHELAETTRRAYGTRLVRLADWADTNGLVLSELKWGDIEGFLDSPAAGRPDRPWGRRLSFAALRFFYRRLYQLQLIESNPMANQRPPSVPPTPRPRILDRSEVRAFLDEPRNPQTRVIAFLLAYAALRLSELVELRWTDLTAEYLTIRNNHNVRMITIHPELAVELARWRETQRAQAARNPVLLEALADPATARLVLTRAGLPMSARGAAAALRGGYDRAATDAPRPSPQLLRRSLLAHLHAAGMPPEDLAILFGLRMLTYRSDLFLRQPRGFDSVWFSW
jgi:integrase